MFLEISYPCLEVFKQFLLSRVDELLVNAIYKLEGTNYWSLSRNLTKIDYGTKTSSVWTVTETIHLLTNCQKINYFTLAN